MLIFMVVAQIGLEIQILMYLKGLSFVPSVRRTISLQLIELEVIHIDLLYIGVSIMFTTKRIIELVMDLLAKSN